MQITFCVIKLYNIRWLHTYWDHYFSQCVFLLLFILPTFAESTSRFTLPFTRCRTLPLSHAACASMSMTTTTTTARDRGDRYGPIEWAQSTAICRWCRLLLQLSECVPSGITTRPTISSRPSNPLSAFLRHLRLGFSWPLCMLTNYIYFTYLLTFSLGLIVCVIVGNVSAECFTYDTCIYLYLFCRKINMRLF